MSLVSCLVTSIMLTSVVDCFIWTLTGGAGMIPQEELNKQLTAVCKIE